jgi:hypothetical protein
MYVSSKLQNTHLQFSRARNFVLRLANLGVLSIFMLTGLRIEVFPVTGKVTFAGQTPTGAQIVLHAVSRTEPCDVAPSATVNSDGTFAISAYEAGDGAPVGDYVATVHWFKILPKEGTAGPNVIPAAYTSAKTSPIKISVKDGPTTVPPIVISANGATTQVGMRSGGKTR